MTAANKPKLEGLEAGSYLTAMDNHLMVIQLRMLNTLLLPQARMMGRHCLSDDLLGPPVFTPSNKSPCHCMCSLLSPMVTRLALTSKCLDSSCAQRSSIREVAVPL